MRLGLDRWTSAAAGAALLIAALLACDRDEQPDLSELNLPPAPEPPSQDAGLEEPNPKLVRYGARETPEDGTVRVATDGLEVYLQAAANEEPVALLSKGTLVNRVARKDDFLLIQYPTGTGQLESGWVQARFISRRVEQVAPQNVAEQDTGVVITDAGKKAADEKKASADAAATNGQSDGDAGASENAASGDAGVEQDETAGDAAASDEPAGAGDTDPDTSGSGDDEDDSSDPGGGSRLRRPK